MDPFLVLFVGFACGAVAGAVWCYRIVMQAFDEIERKIDAEDKPAIPTPDDVRRVYQAKLRGR